MPKEIKAPKPNPSQSDIIANLQIATQKRNLYPIIGAKITIKCPKCKDGTLELLTEQEMKNLRNNSKGDNLPKKIYGCDECKYWIDAELL